MLTSIALYLLLPALSLAANNDGEEIPDSEAQAIRQVADVISAQVKSEAEKNGHAFRDAHRKQHGCVEAKFTVNADLPKEWRKGIFAESNTYSSWIRFSNGSGEVKDDHEGDGRGMAIKLLGVKGARNLNESDDETKSQDFVMINHPVFFVRNASDYLDFQKAVTEGHIVKWFLLHIFHEGRIARAIQTKKMVNPLDASYFSTTASKFGDEQMKFRTIPCPNAKFISKSDSVDRLRENLESTLASEEGCYLFQIQKRTNPASMPIEDPTIEWSEKESPYKTVAKITIPPQKPVQGEECEIMSFNPWNGLTEHRPLGGISRVRKEVYQTISRLRHDLNKQRREEPRSL